MLILSRQDAKNTIFILTKNKIYGCNRPRGWHNHIYHKSGHISQSSEGNNGSGYSTPSSRHNLNSNRGILKPIFEFKGRERARYRSRRPEPGKEAKKWGRGRKSSNRRTFFGMGTWVSRFATFEKLINTSLWIIWSATGEGVKIQRPIHYFQVFPLLTSRDSYWSLSFDFRRFRRWKMGENDQRELLYKVCPVLSMIKKQLLTREMMDLDLGILSRSIQPRLEEDYGNGAEIL